ncbi:MAG: extracellular solute-binding protein [Clostridia bacterium]|nr:extracellular solute-binding protein [Clostridia bacterium]
MKKLLGLMLAVMMVLSISLPIASLAEEPVTITFFDKNSGVRTFDDPVAKTLEERTGIKLELISPSGNPGEKLSLMLAGLNYPDIILMDRSSDIVNQYIEADALVNLSDYLDQMPNVVAMYGDTLNKTRYSDGNNYYLSNWYGYDPDPVNGFICRYDYMIELVGKERADSAEPFTWSEFKGLLNQFREAHPDTNHALVISEPSSGSINGTFAGMNSLYPYYVHDGKLFFAVRDPAFLDAIHQMNEMYREGILDPEWTSNNQELRNQKLSNPGVFAFAGAYWDPWTPSATLLASENENAEYLSYKVVPDDATTFELPLSGRSSLGWDAIAITKNCKNVEAAVKFIDYCASQEGQDLLLWGIQGQDWDFVDGVRTPIGDIVARYQADPSNVVDQTGITKWTWFVKNDVHPDDGTTSRIWFNEKDRSATYAYQNLTDGYYDSAEFANLEPAGSTIEALMYQGVIDVFDQYYPRMVNAATEEQCDALYAEMVSAMESAGMEDIESYMTDLYFARLALWGLEPVAMK